MTTKLSFALAMLEQKITASLLCAPRDNKPVLASVSACLVIILWETFINEECTEETQRFWFFFRKDDLTSHI